MEKEFVFAGRIEMEILGEQFAVDEENGYICYFIKDSNEWLEVDKQMLKQLFKLKEEDSLLSFFYKHKKDKGNAKASSLMNKFKKFGD